MKQFKIKEQSFYKPELDGLRFFAFFLVFVHHHPLFKDIPILSTFHTIGWIGVDLFFVLSAYLFTKLLVLEFNKTQTVSYRKFFLRRIFRIWPVYFLFIIGCLISLLLSRGHLHRDVVVRLGGLFTFSDNIVTVFHGYNEVIPYVSHLWTISFEEQFYLIVPMLILWLVKISFRAKIYFFVSILVLLTVFRLFLIQHTDNYLIFWVLPITHFESILFGIVIGFFGTIFSQMIKPLYWVLFSLLCFAPIPFFDIRIVNHNTGFIFLLTGLSMTGILQYALHSTKAAKFLSQRYLVFLGKRSYGLYLYHFLGIAIGTYFSKHFENNMVLSFVISFLATIIISVISYSFIEKPFLAIKKRYEIVKSRPI